MKVKTEIKYGIYLGLTLFLYTIFMWLTKLDTTYLATGQYLDIAVIILPIMFTFLAIWQKSKETSLTLFKRILVGLTVNFVSFLIHTPVLIIYHHFVNPDWLKYVLELKEKDLLAQNIAPDRIKNTLELIANSSTDFTHIIYSLIVGVIIFGIVFSLLTTPFIRSKSELTS